jgi:protein TonB
MLIFCFYKIRFYRKERYLYRPSFLFTFKFTTMIEKKSSKGNLDKRRITFLLIGFAIVFGLVYASFEFFASKPKDLGTLEVVIIEVPQENIIATDPVQPPPPPAPQQNVNIEIVENDIPVADSLPIFKEFNINENIPDREEPVPLPDEKPDDAPPPYFVEEMPEPSGGFDTMYNFLRTNLKYPEIPRNNGIQGQVFVGFVIEKDGSISNVRVEAGVYPDLDQEAVRVVKLMPKWKPGKQGGKTVRCSYQIPIRFVLN